MKTVKLRSRKVRINTVGERGASDHDAARSDR
jgi:hypothetical protein